MVNMEITDIKMAYNAPLAKMAEVKSRNALCASPYGENTQEFTVGNNRFDESDWE